MEAIEKTELGAEMNFRIASDLHTEFWPYDQFSEVAEEVLPSLESDPESVLLLAGDIAAGLQPEYAQEWFRQLAARFKHVVYIHGNHEAYNATMLEMIEMWERFADTLPNFDYLVNDVVRIKEFRILGTPLFTDLSNPLDEMQVGRAMNDFICIRGWTTKDNHQAYVDGRKFLKSYLSAEDFSTHTVVMTHHLPSYRFVDKMYFHSRGNAGFASNCDDLFELDPNLKLWVFGHTHISTDLQVEQTRFVCNPYGYYGYDVNPQFDPRKIVEV